MKLLNVMLLNLFLLGGLSLSTCQTAKAGELPAEKQAKAMSIEIRQKIVFPDQLVNQNIKEDVKVEFTLNANKTVSVKSVETKNEFLKTYVKQQMESLYLGQYEGFEGKNLEITLRFENQRN